MSYEQAAFCGAIGRRGNLLGKSGEKALSRGRSVASLLCGADRGRGGKTCAFCAVSGAEIPRDHQNARSDRVCAARNSGMHEWLCEPCPEAPTGKLLLKMDSHLAAAGSVGSAAAFMKFCTTRKHSRWSMGCCSPASPTPALRTPISGHFSENTRCMSARPAIWGSVSASSARRSAFRPAFICLPTPSSGKGSAAQPGRGGTRIRLRLLRGSRGRAQAGVRGRARLFCRRRAVAGPVSGIRGRGKAAAEAVRSNANSGRRCAPAGRVSALRRRRRAGRHLLRTEKSSTATM